MLRLIQRRWLVLAMAGAVNSAWAFSLLGPSPAVAPTANVPLAWQIPRIGYNPLGGDIGGPVNLGEEYRWNLKTLTYGFDQSFRDYFGERGMQEVRKAIAILNNLPAMSKTSSNLIEFPTDSKRVNYRASALGLIDLKSEALGMLVEEMGLTSPERYVWTLRDRRTPTGVVYYTVVKRNFDPVTWAPSSYVNGTLYTYSIFEFAPAPLFADAVEIPVDPLQFTFTAVVSSSDGAAGGNSGGYLSYGEYFTGLTRDDVGGLRYLYRPNNYNIENAVTNAFGGAFGSGSPWNPVGGGGGTNNVGGTNTVVATNLFVNTALRRGVDKITFVEGKYDSVFGNFIAVTNTFKDTYVTNGHLVTQTLQRPLLVPDILFSAEDLGTTDPAGTPVSASRTSAAGWVNGDALNGQAALPGPGVIPPQVVITFSKIGPWNLNAVFAAGGSYLDEANLLLQGFVWGSFDGTTNEPVVYPIGSTIQDLERRVLGGR